jgi:SAM-dependent methyltransferase
MSIDPKAVADHERTTWDRCAELYADKLVPLTRQGYQLIVDSGYIRSGDHVLDLGCGPGDFTKAYLDAGATVLGVDFAPEMVRVAQQRFPNVTFKVADAEDLPFDDQSFDVVVAAYVVHHLARPELVFREVHRVLRPRGRFLFVIPIQEDQASFGSFCLAVAEHHDLGAIPGGPLLFETDTEVHRAILEASGFVQCEIERREVICELPALEPLLEGGWQIVNLSALPKETQQAIEATTRKNAEPYKTNDGYRFPDNVFFGSALRE